MKYTVAAVAALAAGSSAQSLSDIPSCALPCIDTARTKDTTCSASDYACICDNIDALTADATSCVLAACGADVAINDVLPAVNTFCAEVAAGGSSSTAETTTAATTTTTAAETTSTAETTSAAETTSEVKTTAETSAVKTTAASTYKATSAVVSSSQASPNATASTASAPSTVVTAGAAVATAGSIGMLLLGALAAL